MVEHYIGIDLHKAFFQACAVDLRGARCWEERFVTSRVGVAAFLSRTPANVVVGVEASGPTWSFVDRLHGNLARVVVPDGTGCPIRGPRFSMFPRVDQPAASPGPESSDSACLALCRPTPRLSHHSSRVR